MRFLALVPVLLLACSNDTFVSTDGGADADHADVGVDGPAPPPDAEAPDACSIGLSCAGGETCVTFDPSEAPFTDMSQAGSTQVSTAESVTCPSSLEADLPTTGAQLGRAIVSADFSEVTASSVTVSMDLSVWLPSNANGSFTAFGWRVGNGDAVHLWFDSGTWSLRASTSSQIAPLQTPVVGGWNHMILSVVFSADTSTGHATLQYDAMGTTPQFATIKDRTTSQSAILGVTAELGLAGTSTNQKMTAYYDDVVITH